MILQTQRDKRTQADLQRGHVRSRRALRAALSHLSTERHPRPPCGMSTRHTGLTPRGCDFSSQSTRRQGHASRQEKDPGLVSHLCQGPPMVPSPLSLLTEYARNLEGRPEQHSCFCALFPAGGDSGPSATVPAPGQQPTPATDMGLQGSKSNCTHAQVGQARTARYWKATNPLPL